MIALLAFIPIRRKNLAALEIARHLVKGDGWFVIIPGEEAKTGTPIEFPVPELLCAWNGTAWVLPRVSHCVSSLSRCGQLYKHDGQQEACGDQAKHDLDITAH